MNKQQKIELLSESSDSEELKARATSRAPTKEATTEKLSNITIVLTRPTKTDAGTISPNSGAYSKLKKTDQLPKQNKLQKPN